MSGWDILVVAAIGAGIALGAIGIARATAVAGWQVLECPPQHEPCRVRGKVLRSPTACALDAASLKIVAPAGTVISCVRATDPEVRSK